MVIGGSGLVEGSGAPGGPESLFAGIGALGKVLKRAGTVGLKKVIGSETTDYSRSILRKALDDGVEERFVGGVGIRVLEFGDQNHVPVVLIGSLFGDAEEGEDRAILFGLLANPHPVVVEIAHRGTEHSRLDFNIFQRPNGLRREG